ncbi:MAG TPA: sensor histidine kinase [Ktedonobacteraceae bacterium]|nr:sensor histidine kinase [Ktedonobacteraceae bacterium]
MLKRFTRPFRQLRGKLTLSYTLTSVVTFLLIELTFIGIVFGFVSLNVLTIVLNNLKQETPQAAPYFVHASPDRQELTIWLQTISPTLTNQGPFKNPPDFLAVVDTHGQTLASIGTHAIPVGTPISAQLSPQSRANLNAVLNDAKGATSKIRQESDGKLVAIAPIVGRNGTLQGALLMKVVKPDIFQLVSDLLYLILFTGGVVTIIAAIAGSIFGYLTARGLTRRLKRLSVAADMWGRGDFSALAHDTSQDELGQTSRQLNRMAEQLQNLLQARQKLAMLEERNRLARDLHDSVKQQVFAISMQIGATKVLLRRDVNAAEARLNEAEKLVKQAQQELTFLIRELRPVALEGKGLVAALRELATDWTKQTGIVATLQVQGVEGMQNVQVLPLAVEEALFRVAQEALSNVARHSNATLVQMTLTIADENVTLAISDNGQGFDTTQHGSLGVGLLSMQERMKALGGEVQVESIPGKGTRIVALCCWSDGATNDPTTEPESKDMKNLSPTTLAVSKSDFSARSDPR